MMADYINTNRVCDLVIKRINTGYYQFGSKCSTIKINKGRLAALTGGGYTGLDEFLANTREKES